MRASTGLVVLLVLASAVPSGAADSTVQPGESIQAAIDAADPGDTISLVAGTYVGDVDFAGKAVTVVGLGPETILEGTGTGPVVTFDDGEGAGSVLDSVVVTGGSAPRGGGILILDASPVVIRTIVFANRAGIRGSGIHVERSSALIRNNLVIYNANSGLDPHAIEVVDASPTIVNNTVVRNDSNGVILRGDSPAVVLNNLLALNGSKGRGRGICDFSVGGVGRIAYNLFWKNRKSALLTDGTDFRKIKRAEARIGPPRLEGNVDGSPRFLLRPRRPPKLGGKRFDRLTVADLAEGLRPGEGGRRLRAVDAGDPDPAHDDLDGSRNDIGFTGGPEAPTW
jgi:hypothetical protein